MKFLRSMMALMVAGLAVSGCHRSTVIQFAGETQGTTYHVTVVTCQPQKTSVELQQRIEQRLADIDLALSNYRDDSELSRFNQSPIDQWMNVGHDFYEVLKISRRISEESGGAFDITVAPLVELWGFGRHRKAGFIPSDGDIAQALALVDYRKLEIDPSASRIRKAVDLKIDVNGIAQGYSVDQLATELSMSGCSDYLVEVGGELRLAGHNAEQKPWHIGIEKPAEAEQISGEKTAEQAIRASNVGITTAGDYHDYFEKDGMRYSHTIDPRTGRPITHTLASVTVIADNAALADGWDTVFEVLGPEAGVELAREKNIAAYFIVREKEKFVTFHTQQMNKYVE